MDAVRLHSLGNTTQWSSIEELSRLFNELPSGQQCCALQMKIKSGLVFEKHSGTLVGFTDLGSVNRDIEMLLHSDSNESNEENLATHAFAFLARAVFKPCISITTHRPLLQYQPHR